MDTAPLCDFCEKSILDDAGTLQKQGLNTVIEISKTIKDGLYLKLETRSLPIPIHVACRKKYTKPSTVSSRKRLQYLSSDTLTSPKRRSQSVEFDIQHNCLYCGSVLEDYSGSDQRIPKHMRRKICKAETKKLLHSIETTAVARHDDWSDEVILRTKCVGDLIAAEAKYHQDCQVKFFAGRARPDSTRQKGRPSGKVDESKNDAFINLCDYIDSCEEFQFSITALEDIMKKLSTTHDELYSTKQLKSKLIEHYGSQMIITSETGKETIYTFLDACNNILRENYNDCEFTKEHIIDMAATIIQDDIRAKSYDLSKYPSFRDLSNDDLVPSNLKRLLDKIITSSPKEPHVALRRKLAIAHSLIAAVRPRSFISPILLAISVYVNAMHESKQLCDILNSLGFADNYREVHRLYGAILPTEEEPYELSGGIINFIFDNVDLNIHTLTGLGTWHAMGGLACSTPCNPDKEERLLPRSTKVRSAAVLGEFGQIPVLPFKRKVGTGLAKHIVGEWRCLKPSSVKLAEHLDTLWVASFSLYKPLGATCPNWSGFMQMAVQSLDFESSDINILPFINLDPTDLSTIYSALKYAQNLCDKHKLGICPVTFDQPLFIKSCDVILSSDDLSSLMARLGGFHTIMLYMGSIGYIMGGSGIEELWKSVYAPKSVVHMLTGHAYARALRAHLFTCAAFVSLVLETPGCLTGINIDRLTTLHQLLLQGEMDANIALNEVACTQITHVLDDLLNDLSSQSRTLKLWTEYIKQVKTLLLFIRAERTGDLDLHLYAFARMIPIFHAAGHLNYARSARVYLDNMRQLPHKMTEEQYQLYKKGYFTIRRTKKAFWSGNFTDQTIEQCLMRLVKAPGGLSHGRGVTESTKNKLVHIYPRCVPIFESLEEFCSVRSSTTEQHKDLRESSKTHDYDDYAKFFTWFKGHSPLNFPRQDRIVSLLGIVAEDSCNAEEAYEVGVALADKVTNTQYSDIKLARKVRVKSINASHNTVQVRNYDAEINSNVLFLRLSCVMTQHADLKNYLQYEFGNKPPALFEKGVMRKNVKSVLATALKETTNPVTYDIPDPQYIVDGGYLLHAAQWKESTGWKDGISTYQQVLASYSEYLRKYVSRNSIVVFDGYSQNGMSTKFAEQQRRTTPNCAHTTLFELEHIVGDSQNNFLANRQNKARLISMLIEHLGKENIRCVQSQSDADYLITEIVLSASRAQENPVILLGNDTDLLAMLLHKVRQNMQIYMKFSANSIYRIQDIQENSASIVHKNILFLHAFSGCDTVSSFFQYGKRKVLKMIQESKDDWDCLDIFLKTDPDKEELEKVGEKFILKLYGAKTCSSLDEFRYLKYMQRVSRKSITSADFQLESLPPTSAAAKFHTFRAYHTIQQWLGTELNPLEWGWEQKGRSLQLIGTDRVPAPKNVMEITSCGCKVACNPKTCKCRKADLLCTAMCTSCAGQTCDNVYQEAENY